MENWFDEIITPQERAEIDRAVGKICKALMQATIICANITDFIDARFDAW